MFLPRTIENENHFLGDSPFRAERIVWLEYRRAANRHAIACIWFRSDRGKLLARAKASTGRNGLDPRRRILDGRRDEWPWQLRDANGVQRYRAGASRARRRLLDGYDDRDERAVREIREGDGIRNDCGTHADERRISNCAC